MALTFASNENVSLSGVTLLNASAWSICFWFKVPSKAGESHVFLREQGDQFDRSLSALVTANDFEFGGQGVFRLAYRADNNNTIDSTATYDDDEWHRAFIVRRASNDHEVFIDGTSDGSDTSDWGTNSGQSPTTFLGTNENGDNPCTGNLARVAVWVGTALTREQAETFLWTGRYPTPPTYWAELETTSARDLSGNNNAVTVTGTSVVDHCPAPSPYATSRQTAREAKGLALSATQDQTARLVLRGLGGNAQTQSPQSITQDAPAVLRLVSLGGNGQPQTSQSIAQDAVARLEMTGRPGTATTQTAKQATQDAVARLVARGLGGAATTQSPQQAGQDAVARLILRGLGGEVVGQVTLSASQDQIARLVLRGLGGNGQTQSPQSITQDAPGILRLKGLGGQGQPQTPQTIQQDAVARLVLRGISGNGSLQSALTAEQDEVGRLLLRGLTGDVSLQAALTAEQDEVARLVMRTLAGSIPEAVTEVDISAALARAVSVSAELKRDVSVDADLSIT